MNFFFQLVEINSDPHQSNTLQSINLFGSSSKSNLGISSQNPGTSFFGSSSYLFSSNTSSNGILGMQPANNNTVAGFYSNSMQPSGNSSGGLFGMNQRTEPPFGKTIVTTNNNLFSTQALSAENPFKSDNANFFSKKSQFTLGVFSSNSNGGLLGISSDNLNTQDKSLSSGSFGGASSLNNSSSGGLFSSGGGDGETQQIPSGFFQVQSFSQNFILKIVLNIFLRV